MTDAEIIKNLECCTNDDDEPNCKECTKRPHIYCMCELLEEALDLIYRQQKYIDKSVKDLKWWLDTNTEKGVVYIPEFVIENIVKGCEPNDR